MNIFFYAGAKSAKELEALLAMHDKFEAFRVILMLKDHNTKIVAVSHMPKPRYITFADSNITNLEEVVSKMQSHTDDTALYN
jgi:hypothetical protein